MLLMSMLKRPRWRAARLVVGTGPSIRCRVTCSSTGSIISSSLVNANAHGGKTRPPVGHLQQEEVRRQLIGLSPWRGGSSRKRSVYRAGEVMAKIKMSSQEVEIMSNQVRPFVFRCVNSLRTKTCDIRVMNDGKPRSGSSCSHPQHVTLSDLTHSGSAPLPRVNI